MPRATKPKAKPKAVAKRRGKAAASSKAIATVANPNTIPVHLGGKSKERRMAEVAVEPATGAAAIAGWMTQGTFGATGIGDLVGVMRDSVAAAKSGDLGEYEGILGAQAHALNCIFLEMTRRAALNMGEYLPAAETYMRLALKAQSQARTTVEALAEIKNPRPVAFVRQANIANGPQQVNNGDARGESNNLPNELQEGQHGQPMAARETTPRLGADSGTATVVAIDRAANPRRKGAVQP
jgi:hypothetical protein